MSHSSGRRSGARSKTLQRSAWALLALGLCLIVGSLAAPGSRLEPAKDSLFLMGVPLVLVGAVLQGLDWMASYTTAAQGPWSHHVNKNGNKPQRTGRKRRRRLGLFGPKSAAAEFGATVGRLPITAAPEAHNEPAIEPHRVSPSRATSEQPAPTLAPVSVPASALASDAYAPTQAPPLEKLSGMAPRRAAPAQTPQPAPVAQATAPSPVAAAVPPARPAIVEPGPDTVIEEFVGYEGQDRMFALHQRAVPPPRELDWPHPPRTAVVDPAPIGNEVFLDKLMDDVLAKIGPATARAPRTADAAPSAASGLRAGAGLHVNTSAYANVNAPAPIPNALYPFQHEPAAAPPQAPAAANATANPPPPPVWTRQLLENVDHWRFAAVVEKLYQQAGFATQLQAGQTMRGVVVLWLFSRHRPGMPASVVSCVHGPGHVLSPEDIVTVAELVKSRGLPRGQLATTASLDAGSLQLASARGVHLMDTTRLLELITRRSPEQQRALADRLV